MDVERIAASGVWAWIGCLLGVTALSTQRFHLFRLTVHPTAPLFPPTQSRPEILRQVIESHPNVVLRDRTWSVANVENVDDDALHFRFGRDGTRSIPVKSESGDFEKEEVSVAPFADVILDVELEVCAIADNWEIGQKPLDRGHLLAAVLSRSELANNMNVSIDASPIKEPRRFLERIEQAIQILNLWVTTKRPNPFDADELFVRPTAKVVEAIGAENARTMFSGGDMTRNREVVKNIVKSTAANGGDAGARLLEKEQPKPINASLTSSLASVKVEADASVVRNVIDSTRDLYDRIRNRSK
jgi:hypothetical protein